jgi:hypothetical protein
MSHKLPTLRIRGLEMDIRRHLAMLKSQHALNETRQARGSFSMADIWFDLVKRLLGICFFGCS